MPEFSSSKLISNRFHFDNKKGDTGISYYMIIVCDLMVHIDLIDDLKRKLLELDHYTVPMKYPCNLLGNTNPTNCEIQEVVI